MTKSATKLIAGKSQRGTKRRRAGFRRMDNHTKRSRWNPRCQGYTAIPADFLVISGVAAARYEGVGPRELCVVGFGGRCSTQNSRNGNCETKDSQTRVPWRSQQLQLTAPKVLNLQRARETCATESAHLQSSNLLAEDCTPPFCQVDSHISLSLLCKTLRPL